jgi:hypothetical protein
MTVMHGFKLRELPEESARDAEYYIRNCDSAFELLMHPVPKSDPMWNVNSSSKDGIDAWKYYADLGSKVQTAFTDSFRSKFGWEILAPNEDIFRGVSTTVLANARMTAPFCDCVFEGHVHGSYTKITPARRAYMAQVKSCPSSSSTVQMDDLCRKNDELTKEVQDLTISHAEALKSAKDMHDAECLKLHRRLDEKDAEIEELKKIIHSQQTSTLCEQFVAGASEHKAQVEAERQAKKASASRKASETRKATSEARKALRV